MQIRAETYDIAAFSLRITHGKIIPPPRANIDPKVSGVPVTAIWIENVVFRAAI
jgi:hypothetical protein